MKSLSKNELIAEVMNLNATIEFINEGNCYDQVISFFRITSYLQDHSKEILNLLPQIEGHKLCGIKSHRRRLSEIKRAQAKKELKKFLKEINKAGRNLNGHNRTKPGEKVTKDNVYFGDISGSWLFPISKFENECKKNEFVQNRIRKQITSFVKSYKNIFNTEWLN